MVCNGCNKPSKQVRIKSASAVNMTCRQMKRTLRDLNLKQLNEVCKDTPSDTSYLHFSTIASASIFYNTYVENGLAINKMHFTIRPTQLSDGTLVTYVPAATPMPSSQANPGITSTDTTPSSDKSLKRAIIEITEEIEDLKRRRGYLEKALSI